MSTMKRIRVKEIENDSVRIFPVLFPIEYPQNSKREYNPSPNGVVRESTKSGLNFIGTLRVIKIRNRNAEIEGIMSGETM